MIRPFVLREDEGFSLGAKDSSRKPNTALQKLAREYVKGVGLPNIKKTPPAGFDEARCRAIAEEFEALPYRDDSDLTRQAYVALAEEIGAQFNFLSGHFSFDYYGDDDPVPYRDSAEMMNDVRENRHLWVFTGGPDHALLSQEDNVKFRAVHDLFGHAAHGFTFGPRGEEAAWVEHQKAFTPLARAAFTTETRGQNSWVNCGPHADLPVKERPYAEQKASLLSEDYWVHPAVEEVYQDSPEFLRILS